ncbi:hypothetical protein COW64_24185 [bacterium (Candidatus Blackallbacteria) CG18_big_fil_WC_8_21_14_2_50_49_26]|nr:MAG: hypothetical protein COW64_24185 [bacterium (Candidatus Blackallbacteria) CG18_big_fil_WC_8_21_14_2_50_49_26]
MLELKRFPETTLAASQDYNTDFSGRVFDTLVLRLDGTVTGGIATITDGAFRALGTPELNQAEEPLIRMRGEDWRHLAALTSGGYGPHSAAVGGAITAFSRIKLSRLVPNMRINATETKVFLRGTSGANNDVVTGNPTYTSTLRPSVETTDASLSRSWARPRITQSTIDVSTISDNIQHVIRFENPTLVAGIMLRVFQSSTTDRVDGLVRAVKLDVTKIGSGPRELVSWTRWGTLRHMTTSRAGWHLDDHNTSVGVAFVPTVDRRNQRWGGALLMAAGESITITLDTSATAEADITAVPAGSSDRVYVTIVAAIPVDPAGSGDGPSVVGARRVAAAPVGRTRSRTRTRRLR